MSVQFWLNGSSPPLFLAGLRCSRTEGLGAAFESELDGRSKLRLSPRGLPLLDIVLSVEADFVRSKAGVIEDNEFESEEAGAGAGSLIGIGAEASACPPASPWSVFKPDVSVCLSFNARTEAVLIRTGAVA